MLKDANNYINLTAAKCQAYIACKLVKLRLKCMTSYRSQTYYNYQLPSIWSLFAMVYCIKSKVSPHKHFFWFLVRLKFSSS